ARHCTRSLGALVCLVVLAPAKATRQIERCSYTSQAPPAFHPKNTSHQLLATASLCISYFLLRLEHGAVHGSAIICIERVRAKVSPGLAHRLCRLPRHYHAFLHPRGDGFEALEVGLGKPHIRTAVV